MIGLLLLALTLLAPAAWAATIQTDCAKAAMDAAIAAARDGDDILVTGTCDVGLTSEWDIRTKSLRIIGINVTLRDAVTVTPPEVMLMIRTGNGKCVHFSGFVFVDPQDDNVTNLGRSFLEFNDAAATTWGSECLRVSNVAFGNMGTVYLWLNDVWGVVDNMISARTINTGGARMRIETEHGPPGTNLEHGNWPWITPSPLGNEKQIVFEDSSFSDTSPLVQNTIIMDSSVGGVFTVRYNDFNRWRVATHGSSQTVRGNRWNEVYRNNMINQTTGPVQFRGGTGVVWENVVLGSTPQMAGGFKDNRTNQQHGNPPFYCNGAAPYDANATDGPLGGSLYAAGTHNGGAAQAELRDTTANWSGTSDDGSANGIFGGTNGNRWYSVINLDQAGGPTSTIINASTANSGTSLTTHTGDDPNMVWNNGNRYEIRRIEFCRDDVGVGHGDVVYTNTGGGGSGGALDRPLLFSGQAKEPVAIWGNTKSGSPLNGFGSGTIEHHIIAGLFTNTPRLYAIQPYRCPSGKLSTEGGHDCDHTNYGKQDPCLKGSCGHSLRWRRIASSIFRNALTVDRQPLDVAPFSRPIIGAAPAITRQAQPVDEM